MADAYLNTAAHILAEARRPLKPREMLEIAFELEILPWHLYGQTQHKTLHARLSEDISINRDRSRFYRTAPGVFFLRDLKDQIIENDVDFAVYLAPRRVKELERDKGLAISCERMFLNSNNTHLVSLSILSALLESEYLTYMSKKEMLEAGYAEIHSFVVVYDDNSALSYQSGKYRNEEERRLGPRSVGVGGAVYESDADMLFESWQGIVASGINELAYAVGLPKRLAENARYQNQLRLCAGVISPKEGRHPTRLNVVLSYACPQDFIPTRSALSINDLRWVSMSNPGNRINHYDHTSQLLFGLAAAQPDILISGLL